MKRLVLAFVGILLMAPAFSQSGSDDNKLAKIQNTFFGLKLGATYSKFTFDNVMSARGAVYIQSDNKYGLRWYYYGPVEFGGYQWDNCAFLVTRKGRLCSVRFENVFLLTSKEEDDALSYYHDVKQVLDERYAISERILQGENRKVRYKGKNKIGATIMMFDGMDRIGRQRRFVDLVYIHLSIYDRIEKQQRAEL